MNADQAPWRITISMRGTRPLNAQPSLIEFLEVFERSNLFSPEKWSTSERGSLPYKRSEILELASRGDGGPLPQAYAFIRRSKIAKYECRFVLSERPGFELEFNANLSRPRWPDIFTLSNQLADVCRPDWGATHLWYRTRERERVHEPWTTDNDRDNELMFRSALLAPVEYYDEGPRGLVMRTHIGPHYVVQFGDERLRTLPLPHFAQPWGGYRVDLVPEPWKASLHDLLPA